MKTQAEHAEDHQQRLLMTPQQAADSIGFTVRFLESRRNRGGGPPYIRIGNRVRYRVEDLSAWAEQHLRTSTSDRGK